MNCRHCNTELTLPLIDLGTSPPSNAYLTHITVRRPEKWFPLRVLVCESCWLVQAESYSRAAELFNDEYAYFSSFSTQWLKHAEEYVRAMTERLHLTSDSHVVEVASNDGYLLQFVKERGIPCLGIEPTTSTASASRQKGIKTLEEFFGVRLAQQLKNEGWEADLMVANNVLAHVPDIKDFASGFATLLKPTGVATFEFPHLKNLIEGNQFDTIYHEHFSYLSLTAVNRMFADSGLTVFDIEEHPTHGGSLRVFAQRSDSAHRSVTSHVANMLNSEEQSCMKNTSYYTDFQKNAEKVKNDFLSFLIDARRQGKKVAGYGAAAKGNTLLNYAGVKADLVSFVADLNPAKQGKFLPGSRIPITDLNELYRYQPDYVVIFPWNIKEEVILQLANIRDWGGKFVTAVPELSVR